MPTEFGRLLRKHRLAAEYSQEALAAAAGISASAVGAYERGVYSAPHRQTVTLLADALALTDQRRRDFEEAAKRKPRRRSDAADDLVIGGLPIELTTFFGRELEVARIQDLLRANRLVTVTGSGGIGKTRVALRAATAVKHSFRDGVGFADLSSISSATSVVAQVALATNVPFSATSTPEDLAKRLGGRELLLFIDNCEHVIDAAASIISAIIKDTPSIKVLATSRERLRLTGETVFRVPTLPVPEPSAINAQHIAGNAAVELFVDRATRLDSDFALTDGNAETVSEICRQLDGIPLALELAAARLSTLGLTYLCAQVKRTITVLSTNNRDVPTHQSTLEATLAWSHALLNVQERLLFRRASVFAGGWTLSAAESVCADDQMSVASLASVMASLVDKSLILVDFRPHQAHYDFLRVTRRFAMTKAEEAAETETLALKHAEWVATNVRAHSELSFSTQPHVNRLTDNVGFENVRSAAIWSLVAGKPNLTSNILWGSANLFFRLGLVGENLDLTRRALRLIDEDMYPIEAAQLYSNLSTSAPIGERIRSTERELELLIRAGEERWIGSAMVQLAWWMTHVGRQVEAEPLALDGLLRIERAGYAGSFVYARSLRAIGQIYSSLRNHAKAREYVRQSLTLNAHLGDDAEVIRGLASESEFTFLEGDHLGALEVTNRAITIARKIGFRREEMFLIATRAAYHVVLGNMTAARDDARTALAWGADNDRSVTLSCIQHLATVAAVSLNPDLGATLIGFSDRELKELGGMREPTEETCFRILEDLLASQSSPDRLCSFREDGGRLTSEAAIALALTV